MALSRDQAVTWLKAQKNKVIDYDGVYGAQCMDYSNAYANAVFGNGYGSFNSGLSYAKELFNGAKTDYYTKIANSASLKPEPGDILVYDGRWGGGMGHVEMCLGSDANGCTVSVQNNSGDPYRTQVQEIYRTWSAINSGLTGVLRPKFNTNITSGGTTVADTITSNDVGIVRIITSEVKGWPFDAVHGGQYDKQEMAAWTGQSLRKLIDSGWKESEGWRVHRIEALKYFDQKATHEAQTASYVAQIQDLHKVAGEAEEARKAAEAQLATVQKELDDLKAQSTNPPVVTPPASGQTLFDVIKNFLSSWKKG